MTIEITEKTPKIWLVVIIIGIVLSGIFSIVVLISNLTALKSLESFLGLQNSKECSVGENEIVGDFYPITRYCAIQDCAAYNIGSEYKCVV